MYTASYIQSQVEAMKSRNTSKADIIRATAEMRLGWQYVYASQGQDCTPQWRRSRIPYCPSPKYEDMIVINCPVLSGKQPTIYCNKPHSNEKMISPESCDGCDFADTDVFDCAGFVLNEMQLAGVPFYGQGATTQWNTASNWAAKGGIESIPQGLVCCLFKRKDGRMSHTGIYLGKWVKDILFDSNTGQQYPDRGPEIIHCSTTVKTDTLPGRPAWTHWGIPKGLYSIDELRKAGVDVADNDNMPTMRRGITGDLVKILQDTLNTKTNAGLNVDGIFGAKTEKAVEKFQSENGLVPDGIVGRKTYEKLGIVSEQNENQNDDTHYQSVAKEKFDVLKTNVLKDIEELKKKIDLLEKDILSLYNSN